MCTESPGGFLGSPRDLVLFYMVIPFGWNGARAKFAIFGDAISCIHAQFGTGRPDWFISIPVLAKLYADAGHLVDIRNETR